MLNNGWEEFALLLIDVQKDFWDETVQESFPYFPEKMEELLQVCRETGLEVIHIRARFSPDQHDWMVPYKLKGSIPCIGGTEGAEILECAREQTGEKIFYKQTFDSFCNPQLHEYLRDTGKRFLLTAGLVTSICVFLTTASAVQRGYLVSLVADGCADQADAHNNTLERYEPVFMPLVRTAEILASQHDWKQMLLQLDRMSSPTAVWADRQKP